LAIVKLKARDLKAQIINELKELLQNHAVFAIAELTGIRAKQLQEMRKKFKDKFKIKVAKNTLMRIALSELSDKLPNVDKVFPYLTGSNAFIFTNVSAFSLYSLLEKNKIPSFAAPGDIAPNDIVVPAGNTGITPGPILSKFSQLKIPTKIQEGSVWIVRDTVVAKAGDVISADLADLLMRLNIKPILVGLKVKVAYDNGLVIPQDQLAINVDEYKAKIAEAYAASLNLAVNAAFPVKEALPFIIQKAVTQAENLALTANILIPSLVPKLLAKAFTQALALAQRVSSIKPELTIPELQALQPTPQPKVEEKKEEAPKVKEEEEKKAEEEIGEGLASLFG